VVGVESLDPVFRHGPHGPTLDSEVVFLGSGDGVPGGTSDREAWILAALAKRRRNFFEFGTATGRTTYLLARNSPDDAQVVTITLRPEDTAGYVRAKGDAKAAERRAVGESGFSTFVYDGTPYAAKVVQLFGDSKALDTAPYRGRFDLIFVDGSHAYSYVLSDTAKALEMLAPGGIIVWHDYRPYRRSMRDVFRALNELHASRPLVRVRETSFVVYRSS
jgi:predicted O-methyltransferase YrrM